MDEGLGMMSKRLCAGAAALCLALSGCSGGTGTQPLFPQLAAATLSTITTKRAQRAERPALTRAVLDTLDGSFMEVTLERSGILAYLFVSVVRQDDLPGQIVQWRTEDNITLTTRNDVLIATRGFGGDMMSSAVQVADGVPGPASGGEKLHMIRTGDLEEVPLVLACDLENLGPEPIEIVELVHPTTHMRETCLAPDGGRVTNDYWVDSRAGIVWQSVQWAGPHVGYVKMRRLTTG
jgi:hypothetical protein